MTAKVNTDNFVIGPESTQREWDEIRRHPEAYKKNREEWLYYPQNMEVPEFPLHVDFEASSLCNMNCHMCWRNRADYDDSLYGHMSFDLFKKGIDECAKYNLYSIRLSWKGECTANPHFRDMVSYAKEKGIKEVSFISNGIMLKGKYAEDVVRAGADYITISVDDLFEQYDKIRYPQKFDDVVHKIQNLRELRDSIGDGFPRIRINCVWDQSKGNEWFDRIYDYFHETVDLITFTPEYSLDRSPKELRSDFTCQYPFQRMTIMWNGKVPLSVSDKAAEYQIGDLNDSSIYDIWHGEKMNKARQLHREHRAHEILCCSICDRAVTKQVEGPMIKSRELS